MSDAPARKLRILYHHRTRSKDGQNVHIEELTAALKRRGHEIVMAEPGGMAEARFGEDAAAEGAGLIGRLKRLLPAPVYELLELGYSIPAYWRLAKACREHRPDVLYERNNLFLLAGAWLAGRRNLPFLLEVNAPLAEERARFGNLSLVGLARRLEHYVWRKADVVLPVTDVLAGYCRAGGVPDGRIKVIPNGINLARFPPSLDGGPARAELGLEGKVVLGFTGFMRAWHGLNAVVDAIAESPSRDNLHFLIVGDGIARAELEAHAAARGVAGQLTVLGVVQRDRVAHYVAAFDVALQPMVTSYASPLKAFEYMTLGKAIVAPDQPNIREILAHEQTALLFDPGRPGAFRAAVERLAEDADLRRRLGAAAAQTIAAHDYTWDGNARRVEDLFVKLLAARRG
jgi:glycosyltransferase involved in cell wall biosynthesis